MPSRSKLPMDDEQEVPRTRLQWIVADVVSLVIALLFWLLVVSLIYAITRDLIITGFVAFVEGIQLNLLLTKRDKLRKFTEDQPEE
jgi:hypothetical protein